MRLSEADQKKYPKFTEYVKRRMPECGNNPTILANLKKYGSMDAKQARHALTWGAEPQIVITDLTHGQCGVPAANGCFRQASRNQIEADKGRVDDFEADAGGLGSERTKSGKSVYVIGTTLLHELCHWGRFANGKASEFTDPKGAKKEAGVGFEESTYGRNIG